MNIDVYTDALTTIIQETKSQPRLRRDRIQALFTDATLLPIDAIRNANLLTIATLIVPHEPLFVWMDPRIVVPENKQNSKHHRLILTLVKNRPTISVPVPDPKIPFLIMTHVISISPQPELSMSHVTKCTRYIFDAQLKMSNTVFELAFIERSLDFIEDDEAQALLTEEEPEPGPLRIRDPGPYFDSDPFAHSSGR